jgi:SAM-dependent methyltransferase
MYQETADRETATAEYAARFSGAAGEFFLARQTDITLELLGNLPGVRLLDVGGGHAQIAEPLLRAGYAVTVTGSDDSCRTRLDLRLPAGSFSYRTCDSLHLPFADRSFEVVTAFRLLPHVSRWQQLLAELCRVADRCVVVDYPDRRSTNIFYGQLFGMKKKMEGNTRPFTLFTRQQIAVAMDKNGFAPPLFRPEFFLPMVLHRKLNNRALSTLLEKAFALSGATRLLGSPIIFRADRRD